MTKLETFIAFTAGIGVVFCCIGGVHAIDAKNDGKNPKMPVWAWFLLTCLLFGTCNSAIAQTDNRWRLVPGIDSLVTGPLSDIRYMAGLRAAKNQQQRDCAWMLARREAELMAMRDARIVMQKALDKSQRTINEAMDQAERMNERANKSDRKAKKKPVLAYAVAGAGLALVLDGEPKNNPAGYALTGVGVGLIVLTF